MMRVFSKSSLLYYIVFCLVIVCSGSSQESFEDDISYHKEFSSNIILLQFLGNEKLEVDIGRIKYLFILPNNFYCENVKVREKVLPMFFINSTKERFLSFLMYVFDAHEKDIGKLLLGKSELLASKRVFLDLKNCLHESFQSSIDIKDFIIGKNGTVCLLKITADCFKSWKFQKLYCYYQSMHFLFIL